MDNEATANMQGPGLAETSWLPIVHIHADHQGALVDLSGASIRHRSKSALLVALADLWLGDGAVR